MDAARSEGEDRHNTMDEGVRSMLKDANKVVIWDDAGKVLHSNFQANSAELKTLTQVFGDRDNAIRHGMVVGGTRYEVHRHHPPAVYGRTMGGDPESSEGAAVLKIENSRFSGPAYCFISYQ